MSRVFRPYQSWRVFAYFCLEFFLLSGAVVFTTSIRFSGQNMFDTTFPYVFQACLIAGIYQVCMYYADLYDLTGTFGYRRLLLKLTQAFAATMAVSAVLCYLIPQRFVDRGVLLLSIIVAFGCISGWRFLYQRLQSIHPFRKNVLILGTGDEAQRIAKELLERQPLGYDVKGFVDEDPEKLGTSIVNPKVLGNTDQLPVIVEREGIGTLIVALSDRRGKLPLDALVTCKLQGVEIEEGATFYEHISGRIMLENLRPSWLIFSQGFGISSLTRFTKRAADILLSFLGLLCAMPFIALSAIVIVLDSRGPIFFSQQRVGQHGKLFTLRKLRSMRVDAEELTGPVYATKGDSRITRVGGILRATRLDELPQLLNVLKGEMSFVGPRPERPFFVKQFEEEIMYYRQRLAVKPGLTGWAQINYPYGATFGDAIEKLRYDLYYIKNLSLLLDIFILLKTVKIVVLGRGAR